MVVSSGGPRFDSPCGVPRWSRPKQVMRMSGGANPSRRWTTSSSFLGGGLIAKDMMVSSRKEHARIWTLRLLSSSQ